MKENDYTDAHCHPVDSTVLDFVAYQRHDGSWDAYMFEPRGSCPELEAARTDENHIFLGRIASGDELDMLAAKTEESLGDGYKMVSYYREAGTRRMIGKIVDYLRHHGAYNMSVHSPLEDVWELRIRKKDVPLARQVIAANMAD